MVSRKKCFLHDSHLNSYKEYSSLPKCNEYFSAFIIPIFSISIFLQNGHDVFILIPLVEFKESRIAKSNITIYGLFVKKNRLYF